MKKSNRVKKPSSVNKKKVIVLASMVLLLVATGVLSYFLNVKAELPGDNSGDLTPSLSFFEKTRNNRAVTRETALEIIDSVLLSEASTEEAIADAEQQKLAITKAMEDEYLLETRIAGLGFDDCIVTIGNTGVNVIVKKEGELSLQEASQIFDVIVTSTEYTWEQIEVNPY